MLRLLILPLVNSLLINNNNIIKDCVLLNRNFNKCYIRNRLEYYEISTNHIIKYHLIEKDIEESDLLGNEEYTIGVTVDSCSEKKSIDFPWGNECIGDTMCIPGLNYTCKCSNPFKSLISYSCIDNNIVLIIQIIVIVCITTSGIGLILNRRNKIIGMWSIYGMIHLGGILFNLNIVVMLTNVDYNCLVSIWLKEVGFILVNGPLILKLYRSFVEFRTRKAHRWIVREKDILKYELVMFTVVVYYLISWTIDNYDRINCIGFGWIIITDFGELIFLSIGLNISWHLKNSTNVYYYETYWLTGALVIQITGKIIEICLRQLFNFNDSIWIHFILMHTTITTSLIVVVMPKFYYIITSKQHPTRNETIKITMKDRIKILETLNNGGELDFNEINITDMDPQDIRYELKRVYTQLEVLRNKTMRRDNPHISKRRGGRKPTHRRFSLQKRGSREKQQKQPTGGPNRQRSVRYLDNDLEDSICSIEGPSTYSEASWEW